MDLRRGGKAAIDRIMKAYGFTTKQALCDKLGISSSTLANRYTRDSLPTDFIVQCAIETGASVEWLAFGTQNNRQVSSPSQTPKEQHQKVRASSIHSTTHKYPYEIKIDPDRGGKAAIERLVEAYGFTTRQALADHLNVSKSTLANRYLRDTFPADWIIQCALDTKVDLAWLVNGVGPLKSSQNENLVTLNKFDLMDGLLCESGFLSLDRYLLPEKTSGLVFVSTAESHFVCDKEFIIVRDGKWLVKIDSEVSFRELTRLPKNKVFISGGSKEFECSIDDIEIIASVILTMK